MKFLSLCSGIDAASVASAPLGWSAVGFSEIEPFPSAVLAHHYPSVPNFGDMTQYLSWPETMFSEADAIVGGPPCQAFSMAGKRAGLDDARGNLTLTYANLIDHADLIRAAYGKRPVVALYENVPGILSDRTNAFGCLLGKLAGENVPLLPPGGKWSNAGVVRGPARTIAWRVLDAQYFGVAQRRRRVFVVAGAAGCPVNPVEILFESEGVRRDTAPRREPGKGVTEVAGTLSANGGGTTRPAGNCNELDFCVACMAHGQANAETRTDGGAPTLTCNHEAPIISYGIRTANTSSNGWGIQEELTHTLDTAQGIAVSNGMAVRRLTPVECERLQGFPDGYTAIPWKNKPASECPDGPRYKALGNSWAVPVVRWIFSRISSAK